MQQILQRDSNCAEDSAHYRPLERVRVIDPLRAVAEEWGEACPMAQASASASVWASA